MKRVLTLFVLLIYILTLTGCWDARELDTLSIVAGVGIDTAPQQGEYVFTMQIGKAQKTTSGKNSSTQNEPYLVLEATDKTMLLAMEQLRLKSSRELFLHPNQVVIFGKDMAAQGIGPVMDMFIRDHESRLEVWVLVADGTAKDVLAVDAKLEPIPAAGIARMMVNASGISKYYGTKMIELVSRLADKGTSSIIPIISTVEEDGNLLLSLSGSAVFNNDKMVGQLNIDETRGYVYAMGDVKDGILEVRLEDGTAVSEISSLSAHSSPLLKDGKITIELNVNVLLALGEIQGFKDQKMVELLPKIQKAASDEIAKIIVNTFAKTQSMETDIFGYGLSIYKKYPKEWEKMKDDWDSIYSGITLNLTVNAQMSNTGMVADSLDMRGTK